MMNRRIVLKGGALMLAGGAIGGSTRAGLDKQAYRTLLHYTVTDGAKLKAGAEIPLKGIAFDGGSGIKTVSVSSDGGKTWTAAKLGKDLGKFSFREWQMPLKLDTGEHELKVRATKQ
jgi:Mo-co oxidoreductase dimerisation domain